MVALSLAQRAVARSLLDQRVLIIDDDRDFAESMCDSLALFGWKANAAFDATQALAVAEEAEPEVALVDLRLGESNGLDLIPALQERFPNILSLIVTAYPDVGSNIRAIQNNVEEYLVKPVHPEAVVRALDGCFERVLSENKSGATKARRNLFGRLLVERFAHLFAEVGRRSGQEVLLYVHILPGFFLALDKMLGPERMEENQEKCRRIIQRIGKTKIGGTDWKEFFADQEARALARDAEILIAEHFRDFDKRCTWFINLFDSNLAPYPSGDTEQAVHWPLSQVAVSRLLYALFSDLREELNEEKSRLVFIERHGTETYGLLAEILERIERSTALN